MAKRSEYKGCPRLRWVEPRRFDARRWRRAFRSQGPLLLRGMALGVGVGLAIIAGVWWFQPLARPSLPRATLGLVVMPFVLGILLFLEAGGTIAFGTRVDVRAGRAFIQRGRGGCYMSREGMSRAFVEAVGDVPVELGLVGRLGHRRHLRKRETTVRIGVDPEIGVGELVGAIEACLGVRAEVRGVEGGVVGGDWASG